MSASIFDEIKKKENGHKKEKLKTIIAIATTNILVAMICLRFGETGPAPVSVEKKLRVLHPHFTMVKLPIKLLVENDIDVSELPVTIMDKNNKILIEKAYLHEEISKAQELGSPAQFKIEIPEGEVLKISANEESQMVAIPETHLPKRMVKPTLMRKSPYEVSL